MAIQPNQLYFLKGKHFDKYKQYTLFTDYNKKSALNKGERPYYVCLTKPDVCWVIPVSSVVDKYKLLSDREVKRFGVSTKFHFTSFKGVESVLLIQNAFPISYRNINHPYLDKNGSILSIANKEDVMAIQKKLHRFTKLLSKGITFYPNQPNVLQLERDILNDVKFERYVQSLMRENQTLKNPFKLDTPVINLIKEYNKMFLKPKTLKEICLDFNKDLLLEKKNPLLQSIGTYLKTQQQNNIARREVAIDLTR